jgi:acetylornithine deacetylase/succinyl-diaminopimelate desuccinylase-like protein
MRCLERSRTCPDMLNRFLVLCASVALAGPSAAAQSPYVVTAPPPPGFDRATGQRVTREHLERLIRLDTQNPPGNELTAARYFDSVFKEIPGVETHVLVSAPNRANFIARLRAGAASKRPVLIMGHMDVVGADTAKWETNPFVPTEKNGYIYGRGAIDDKGMLAAAAAVLQQLAARRARLTRDVIFLATAAEEGGDVGIDVVADKQFDLIRDVEFALNEGGRVRVQDGFVRTVNIQTTEKVSYNVVATAAGPSGHGSVPLPDNALAALARAVARVHAWQAPVELNETTRLYFARLATIEKDSVVRRAMQHVGAAESTPAQIAAAADVLSRAPLYNAVLRTGQSLTLLSGGIRSNVIPSEGRATFNVRVLPNDDVREIVRAMQRAGAEPQVTFRLAGAPQPAPPPSPVASDLFRSMESAAKAMEPRATVIPFMSTGATDGAVLRAKGIPTYGILPMPLPMDDELRMHGDNERVPVEALGWAAEYLYRVLVGVM